MTKTIEDSVHVQNQEKQGKGGHLTHAAWVCAAAVFLTFSYANQMVAQTLVKSNEIYKTQKATVKNASTKSTNSNESGTQVKSLDDLLDELKGTNVIRDNARNIVTVGRPEGDAHKIFLLYNVGTHKFVNLGGYWGTHATLSDVPRFFWLQRRNETTEIVEKDAQGNVISKEPINMYAYARYPESDGTRQDIASTYINPLKNFIKQTEFQVGSKEGSKRPHAEYEYVSYHRKGIVDTDESHSNVLKDGVTNVSGRDFVKEFSGNLSNKVIESDLDLTTCTSGEKENILSIGTNIGSTSEGNNIHIYCDGTKLYVDEGSTNKKEFTLTDNNKKVNVRLHKNGLYIGSERILTADDAVVSSLLSMDASTSKIQVGSKVGEVRSNATYNTLSCNTLAMDGTDENVVAQNYESTGQKVIKYFPGCLKDYKSIDADIDLTNCNNTAAAVVLSIGTNISEWGNDGNSYNIHIDINPKSWNSYSVYTNNSHSATDDNTKWFAKSSARKLKVSLDATNGLVVYDTNDPTNKIKLDTSNEVISKLLDAANTSELQIGFAAGVVSSNAIYKSLTVSKYKEAYQPNGQAFSTPYTSSLANKTISAEIDVSNCKEGEEENIFSFGSDITRNNQSNDYAAVHFYYNKSDNSISYEFAGVYYGKSTLSGVTPNDGKVTIKWENNALSINGTSPWLSDDIKNFLTDETKTKVFYVGSQVGNHSYATYNDITVKDNTKESTGAKPLAKSAATNSDDDEVISLYDSSTDKPNSDGYVKTVKNVNFENDGEYIEAQFKLNDNMVEPENLFSIGQDIDHWGSSDAGDHKALKDGKGNLHIYYIGMNEDKTKYKFYVAFVCQGHNDDLKRVFYVPRENNSGTVTIKLSKAYLQINNHTIYTDEDPMPVIPTAPTGYDGEIVRFKFNKKYNFYEQGDDGKFIIIDPSDEANYADAKGLDATYNGYIYTNESRSENKMTYFITSKFVIGTTVGSNEGNYFGWTPKINEGEFGSIGIFGDRELPQKALWDDSSRKDLAINGCQWNFESVGDAENNTYRMYVSLANAETTKRNTSESESFSYNENQTGKFYLTATTQNVYGDNNESYGGGYVDQSSNIYDSVEAINYGTNSAPSDDYSKWRLISLADYLTLFDKSYKDLGLSSTGEVGTQIDVSYRLKDPDFKRRNADLNNWHLDTDLSKSSDKVRVGFDNCLKKFENGAFTSDYYTENGTAVELTNNQIADRARYMGAQVKEESSNGAGEAKGKFYQTVEINNPGYYVIKCNGFTTRNSKLYVNYNGTTKTTLLGDLSNTGTEAKLTENTAIYNMLNSGGIWTVGDNSKFGKWPFTGSYPLYNSLVYMEDENVDDPKNLKTNYTRSIQFYVDENMLTNAGGKLQVELGIMVDHVNSYGAEASSNAISTQEATSSTSNSGLTSLAWTVFDNFKLLYGGRAENPDLILDELSTNLDYIDKTIHRYRSSSNTSSNMHTNLRLARTFTTGKWNSIILPVGLTIDQYNKAFESSEGANDGCTAAPLAELNSVNSREIKFKSVTESKAYTGVDGKNTSDGTEYWLRPMTPYIIKANKANGGTTTAYDGEYFYWDHVYNELHKNDASVGYSITKHIGGEKQPYFLIPDINMVEGVVKTKPNEGDDDDSQRELGNYWDFADMKESVNSQDGSAYNVKKDCPYVVKGLTTDKSTDRDDNTITMTAYGLLAMNVKVDNDGNVILNNNIPTLVENRPSMADSYIMQNNVLTYKNSKQWNASKAFRCWFEYSKAKPTSQAKPTLLLDGVNMTTGIDNIMDNDEGITPIDQYKKGIFNLGGQLLSKDSADFDKLPKGIYIVDGKKVTKE